MVDFSISTVLRERASLQSNDTAFTYIDYEQDWDGVAETLTWSQLYRRTVSLAQQLKLSAATGERAVILAPQGVDYLLAFLGAIHAGLIAVPLSVPQGGAHDERTISVLGDTSPAVILTTSAVVDNVTEYVVSQPGQAAPTVVKVDLLDLNSRQGNSSGPEANHEGAVYLQYTSGSTREPAGVMVSNRNIMANFEQIMSDYFVEYGKIPPADATMVSWLPFYHDMGLALGILVPILAGIRSVLTSPVAFLQRPARWIQLMATNSHVTSAAPNFAYELAVRKTSDDDMVGLDLGSVIHVLSGSERVHPETLKRFSKRFAPFNFRESAIRPSYGLAEAMVYVATRRPGQPPEIVHFESGQLAGGTAKRCADGGTPLVSYGVPQSQTVRIVDPEARTECPEETVGEIWLHGDNVAIGYWEKSEGTERTFRGRIIAPSAGTPEGPWLRTGDSGFFSEGELFIIGRIKDLLIVYGRNHSPDDIEATIQEITGGRCVAISVSDVRKEKLVAIIELKKRGNSDEEAMKKIDLVKREVTSAISKSHGLSVSDLVMVSPGSIPITTSGKVRRAQCVELYRQDEFTRLDT